MDKWLGLITPVTTLLGFLMTVIVVSLLRFQVNQMGRAELNRQLADWRQYAEDSNKMLVAIRDELKETKADVQRNAARIRELDQECMDLTRERRAVEEYARRLATVCRENQLPIPARPDL